MELTPELGTPPFVLTLQRSMSAPPASLYRAWTRQFDRWFADPGTVVMAPEVNAPYFFETRYQNSRHPTMGAFSGSSPPRLSR
jgi:uncharacterized protein YndB with AHSA1/START domain